MSKVVHEERGEFGGYTIRESENGFILDRWCSVPGAITDRRVLVPYSIAFPKGTDFSALWNAHATKGAAFCYNAIELKSVKVLKRGHIVAYSHLTNSGR